MNEVLNLGIKPDILIAMMKDKYVAMGGTLYEGQGLQSISIYSNVAQVKLTSGTSLTSRLVVDAMGNASPIRSGLLLILTLKHYFLLPSLSKPITFYAYLCRNSDPFPNSDLDSEF